MRFLCRLQFHDWADWERTTITTTTLDRERDTDAQQRTCDACGYTERERIYSR